MEVTARRIHAGHRLSTSSILSIPQNRVKPRQKKLCVTAAAFPTKRPTHAIIRVGRLIQIIQPRPIFLRRPENRVILHAIPASLPPNRAPTALRRASRITFHHKQFPIPLLEVNILQQVRLRRRLVQAKHHVFSGKNQVLARSYQFHPNQQNKVCLAQKARRPSTTYRSPPRDAPGRPNKHLTHRGKTRTTRLDAQSESARLLADLCRRSHSIL